MAKTKRERGPRIVGVVRHDGKAYRGGDEAALAKLITAADVDHLRAVGAISGTWNVASTPEPAKAPAKK